MRSPGLSRIVHTRTRSLSETSALPTHGLGLFFSRSNSATSSGAHADVSAVSGCLSSIVRAMAFLRVWSIYSNFCAAGNGGNRANAQGGQAACAHRRRLDERTVGGAD